MKHRVCAWAMMLLVACSGSEPIEPTELTVAPFETLEELGEALFFETAISANQTQSCATCHDPEKGYTDHRSDDSGRVLPLSRGADGVSFGRRNAPTTAYAAWAPTFAFGNRQRFNKQDQNRIYEGPLGGLFHDGRVETVEEQSGLPPLGAAEMGMPSEAAVIERLAADPMYVSSFEHFYGEGVMQDVPRAYLGMTEAIGAYERTPLFSPFDSKYDRSLNGEATLSFKELTGRALFFSEFANCAICHQLENNGDPIGKFRETFTGYEFHNIGVPLNPERQQLTGITEPDLGLLGRDDITNPAHAGQFKTPTLRNVAVTGPYMHNGVFTDLRTVIEFYDKYNNPERTLNPETALPWGAPEISENVELELLQVGRPMSDLEVESMVCFLRTLTDARYEPLLESDGTSCDD